MPYCKRRNRLYAIDPCARSCAHSSGITLEMISPFFCINLQQWEIHSVTLVVYILVKNTSAAVLPVP